VPSSPTANSSERPLIVGLGGSAGALSALTAFFDALPDQPDEAFVVVLHMPADEESSLAEILSGHTSMPVWQVNEPVEVEPNHVYVAPPGRALTIEEGRLTPVTFDESTSHQAPIDQFFRSLAQNGAATVGVVLSGTGSDGTVGLRAIKEAGGLVAAQDPEEAEYDVMPRSAIQMGRIDLVKPVAKLAERVGEQRALLNRLTATDDTEEEQNQETVLLEEILEHVRVRTGHDFSEYKTSTMQRRVQRRMQVNQIASLEEYREYLQGHPKEVQSLQKDLLISVTSFFRDPEHWEALQQRVVPALFEGKTAEDDLRTWVVGTATGEEAYSLTILLLEQARTRTLVPETIQVFATDIDEAALGSAREGRYPESIAADVPAEYLDRYFVKEGTKYAVKDFVREHILFTPHSLLRDPPFSKLDLVSCRNLLIYLRRDLQTTVFDLFGYALNEGGYLFLGTSESAERADGDFRTVDASHRIYQLRNRQQAVPKLPSLPLTATPSQLDVGEEELRQAVPSEATAHQRLLEAHSPPSVVVNEDYRLLHLSDDAGRYLKHPSGTPRTNIVELVRPELQARIRSVLHEAFADNRTVRSQLVRVKMNGLEENVRLVAHPGSEEDQTESLVLLLFEQAGEDETRTGVIEEVDVDSEEASTEEKLRSELKQTKKELRATVEEYESSQQKLQAANEELRSMNEEYKSMTEELETSKEELQSVNEELKTVNQELEEKVEQLRQANSDLKNVMASTQIGTLFLDRELRIQRYTPRVEELFNIRPEDEDRPIGDLTHHLDYDSLVADAEQVLDDLQPLEREVPTDEGEWFLVRHHPYRTHDDRIDGVVSAFIDITDRRTAEEALRRSEEFHRLAVEAGQVGTWDIDLESGEAYVSSRMAALMGYTDDAFSDTGGRWQQVVPEEAWQETVHPNDRAALLRAVAAARGRGVV